MHEIGISMKSAELLNQHKHEICIMHEISTKQED